MHQQNNSILQEKQLQLHHQRARVVSSFVVSALIFLTLFTLLSGATAPRDRINYLVAKLSPEGWCPRFERFLVSSANPKILIFSSSTGLVPSQLSDVKNRTVKQPHSVVEMHYLSQHYESPAFFLQALSANNSDKTSAAHMGIPAATISDYLLLLEKALSFQKHPETVVYILNARDFLVPANYLVTTNGSPIQQTVGDIKAPWSALSVSRMARQLSVLWRWSYLARIWNEQRFYFAYKCYLVEKNFEWLAEPLINSDILRNRLARKEEQSNIYDPKITSAPSLRALDPTATSLELENSNSEFAASQYLALQKSKALLESHGINLLIVVVPLYPGVHAPATFTKRFDDMITEFKKSPRVKYFDAQSNQHFDYGHFEDALHLNALGGEIMFWKLANFLCSSSSGMSVK